MPTLFINGKFTAQRLTGVQRYASEMVKALDEAVAPGERWVLLVPAQAQLPKLRNIRLRPLAPAGMPLHLWEQTVLPWAARTGLLLNLAGSAPLMARRQWCTFHDAAVFDHPDAYTTAFRLWYRMHFRWLARRADRVLTVSMHSRQRLALRLDMPQGDIAVVPNGGDHMLAVQADQNPVQRLDLQGRRWLLAVGSDNRLKNWPALLQAWQRVAVAPDWRLVLVGGRNPGVFAGTADSTVVSHGSDNVIHAGPVNDGELKALMQAAHALVMPSLDEGFGLPPLEALTLGCPVAVSRAGALPEVCGDAALYLDALDGVSITAALQALVDDTELRGRLSNAGPARAASFTWTASATRLRALLQDARALS